MSAAFPPTRPRRDGPEGALGADGGPLGLLSSPLTPELVEGLLREVAVRLVWEPPWNPEKMSDEARARLGL